MPGRTKKLVEAHQLSSDDEEQYIAKGCALIRANFKIDPHTLEPEQWAGLFCEAAWLESKRLSNLATILTNLFSTEDNERQ